MHLDLFGVRVSRTIKQASTLLMQVLVQRVHAIIVTVSSVPKQFLRSNALSELAQLEVMLIAAARRGSRMFGCKHARSPCFCWYYE